jgi:hypothetical protein
MAPTEQAPQASSGGIFRLFEFLSELVGWLQIVASPFLIGAAVGAVIYFTDPTALRLGIGIAVAAVGLVIGIIWATITWRRRGTMSFLSRTMATPELDDPAENQAPPAP